MSFTKDLIYIYSEIGACTKELFQMCIYVGKLSSSDIR